MRLVSVLIALAASGCTFGFGSPYVGQWRAKEVVEFEVCVEDESGQCGETTQVTKQQPARKFWGFSMSYPMMGISFPSIDGVSETAFRAEMTAEYLQGRGRFAFGVRQSAVFDINDDLFVTAPLMATGHVGLNDRIAVYGGAGYSWYNLYQRSDGEEMTTSFRSRVGGRILGGLQLVGNRSHTNTRILYSLEADASASSLEGMSYRSWGLSLSIGAFL